MLSAIGSFLSPSILGRDKSPDSYVKDARLDSIFRNIWLRKTAKHDRYRARRSELTLSKDFSKVPIRLAYDFFEPEWNCEDEVRFGSDLVSDGDGPKFTCGVELLNSLDECIVYSIGSNYDFSFEYAVHNTAPHCVIHTFDGTLNLTERALPDDLGDKNIHFHNQNVVAEDCHAQSSVPSLCVADVLKKLNHEHKTITWLKVDCEGCEFTVMPIFMKYEVKVDQIMIEVHGTDAVQVAELFQVLHDAGRILLDYRGVRQESRAELSFSLKESWLLQ